MVAYDSQATVDAAFADLASLLETRDETPRNVCCNCGSTRLQRCSNVDSVVEFATVCCDCGAEQSTDLGSSHEWLGRAKPTNYKRIHHWHERISQLLLCESEIPADQFLRITQRLCDGSYTVINKDVIRSVLRSLNMQLYIEKWLQIIQRITLIEPPKPGSQLMMKLDAMFQEMQVPFTHFKNEGRKNFLNYNYVFCRLFQKLGCPQFSMFFPLIKSKAKLKTLDDTWKQMCVHLNWEFTPLLSVASFAVKLEVPAVQLQRIEQLTDCAIQAATHTRPAKTVFRKSDLRLLRELDRQKEQVQRRSTQPERVIQKPAWLARRPQFVLVRGLQPLRRSRPRQPLV